MECENQNMSCRERTVSTGGSSDSELSESWNVIEHINSADLEVPSSDGESIEVIEAEEENSTQEDKDCEQEVEVATTELQVVEVATTELHEVQVATELVVQPEQSEVLRANENPLPVWSYLALAALIVSYHLAHFTTNDSINLNKPLEKSDIHNIAGLWTKDKKVMENYVREDKENVLSEDEYHATIKKQSLKDCNYEFGDYVNILINLSSSFKARKKFSQVMDIIQILNLEMNNLEENITSPILNQTLHKQKRKLNHVLKEVKSDVSRAIEKMATNFLKKVQSIERKFESEWCNLQNYGHNQELKGLFYDCDDMPLYDEKKNKNSKNTHSKHSRKSNKKNNRRSKDELNHKADPYEQDYKINKKKKIKKQKRDKREQSYREFTHEIASKSNENNIDKPQRPKKKDSNEIIHKMYRGCNGTPEYEPSLDQSKQLHFRYYTKDSSSSRGNKFSNNIKTNPINLLEHKKHKANEHNNKYKGISKKMKKCLDATTLPTSTSLSGYWFLKTGDHRSRIRRSHHQSDWWFDRACSRRYNQYPDTPSWIEGRRKNWFFQRAWARQQCKLGAHTTWCQLDDETFAISS